MPDQTLTLTLDSEIDIARGDLLAGVHHRAHVVTPSPASTGTSPPS